MKKTAWYSGLSKDIPLLDDTNIVLHADDEFCRILSRENGQYYVSDHPSIMMSSAELVFSSRCKPTFEFNDKEYLQCTRYIRSKVEDESNLPDIYKQYCEYSECHCLKNFINSLAYSSASLNNGKMYNINIGTNQVSAVIGIVRDNIRIGCVSLTLHAKDSYQFGYDYEIENFNKHEVSALIADKIKCYGEPADRSEIVGFVQNYFEMLAKSLSEDSILLIDNH